jgi:hypothetical protein
MNIIMIKIIISTKKEKIREPKKRDVKMIISLTLARLILLF